MTHADSSDANGNKISSAGITNTYDFENQLLTHGPVTMVYDGDGNRVSETVDGVTTKYLVDTLNPTGYVQVMDEVVGTTVTRGWPTQAVLWLEWVVYPKSAQGRLCDGPFKRDRQDEIDRGAYEAQPIGIPDGAERSGSCARRVRFRFTPRMGRD